MRLLYVDLNKVSRKVSYGFEMRGTCLYGFVNRVLRAISA